MFSRYSLERRALVAAKTEDVRLRLERLFWKHGLPRFTLNDNCPPLGSMGLGRLSRLGVWLPRLGVQPIFIEPDHFEQNGRHERFHETLTAEAASPPRVSIRAQQAAFDRIRAEQDDERPHEALGMRTPSQIYAHSLREMPISSREHEFAEGVEARRVRRDGMTKWEGGYVFIDEAMAHELMRAGASRRRTLVRATGIDEDRRASRAIGNRGRARRIRRSIQCHPCARTAFNR